MKLKSFRIKNYKSIVDSNECIISESDNITILAGQNESGKSSILQALRDYHNDSLSDEAIRIENEVPEITCSYIIEVGEHDIMINDLKEELPIPSAIEKYIRSLKEITFIKTFDDLESPKTFLIDKNKDSLEQILSKEIARKELSEINFQQDKIFIEGEDPENESEEEESKKDDSEEEKSDKEESGEEVGDEIGLRSKNYLEQLTYILDSMKPVVIFFDDFCDLLPDKILINDLTAKNKKAKGYQAGKNIETILKVNFTDLDKLGDSQRNRAQAQYHKLITANFNEKWTQKINENDKAKIHIKYEQGRAEKSAYLNFFIETKDEEFLPPRQRSQGFRWFLSFYLHLKAESERNNSLIILFDEPGLFLHSKAQNDMVKVFEELALKNQILYSTHSPYLIDTSKLHRIKLVLNTREFGTTIEKITTSKVKNQKDALKPIIDAIGLEIATNFSPAKRKNVILEGISDYYYFQSFKKILNIKEDYAFVPAMGCSNVHLLMELCIGWGLDWLIVFDDKGVTKEYNKIKKFYFNNNEEDARKKVFKLNGFEGIEELFDDSDMNKLISNVGFKNGSKKGDFVSENGGKELTARLFMEKITTDKYLKKDFTKSTIENFQKVFDFISNGF